MKNLYDIVAKKVIEFCRKGYFADCLVKFEMSYDGKEWDKVTCVVECDINEDIVFQWDFCEGQKYIRNFKICHTNDALIPSEVEPIIRCKECKWCHSGYCAKADDLIPFGLEQYEWEDWYCAWGKRRDEVEE